MRKCIRISLQKSRWVYERTTLKYNVQLFIRVSYGYPFFFSQNGIQEKTKTICISFQSKTLWFQKVFMEHKKIEHSTQFECTTEMQFDKDFHHSRLWLCKTFLSALSSKILLTPLCYFFSVAFSICIYSSQWLKKKVAYHLHATPCNLLLKGRFHLL